ncbi:initiation factor 2 [Dipodascopsis uninucleata]
MAARYIKLLYSKTCIKTYRQYTLQARQFHDSNLFIGLQKKINRPDSKESRASVSEFVVFGSYDANKTVHGESQKSREKISPRQGQQQSPKKINHSTSKSNNKKPTVEKSPHKSDFRRPEVRKNELKSSVQRNDRPTRNDNGRDSKSNNNYTRQSHRNTQDLRSINRSEPRSDHKKSKKTRSYESDEITDDTDFGSQPKKKKHIKTEASTPVDAAVRLPTPKLLLPPTVTVANMARLLGLKREELIVKMGELGFENLTPDYVLDFETSSLVALEFGFDPASNATVNDIFPAPPPENLESVPSRPPFVTIMGHVDHGKTTILDYLRKSSIVDKEFGGITQHIGAFSVPLSSGKRITFLDTPGHAAFLKMRQRGANVTDIVVLVVAADDSVMPQTKEAINHAKKANVPIIVAINKIDKPGTDLDKVYRDLGQNEIYVEEIGGDVQCVKVSGLTGQGIDELEDAIIALSEIQDFRAPLDGNAEGYIIESSIQKGRGNVATLVVRRGVLKTGDFIVAGTTFAKVRSLRDELGKVIKSAGPGTPVEVDGWKDLPESGDEALEAKNEKHAKDVVEFRRERIEHIRNKKDLEAIAQEQQAKVKRVESQAQKNSDVAESDISTKEEETAKEKILSFIIKSDVAGSAEAVSDSIAFLEKENVKCKILYSEVGAPSESDVTRAEIANAKILCFNVKTSKEMNQFALQRGVQIASFNVIYHLVEHVMNLIMAQLEPEIQIRVIGEAEIRQIFEITEKNGKRKVAGCRITNGVIKRNNMIRILRDNEEIFLGSLDTLRQVKKDIAEIRKGSECGMSFKGWTEFLEDDTIQAVEEYEVPKKW